jgi:hypothetical protein
MTFIFQNHDLNKLFGTIGKVAWWRSKGVLGDDFGINK